MTHSEYIRTRRCLIGFGCSGDVVGHHVRTAANAGTGMKPDDRWLVPLCDGHHREGHQRGWKSFERRHRTDLAERAAEFWRMSPARRKG